ICFIFVVKPEWFGITDSSFAARFSFLLVGLWWILFSQIPFRTLPEAKKEQKGAKQDILKKGFVELKKVWNLIKGIPVLKRFLTAFFFYAMGVQTIMLVSAAFGEKVLGLGASKLIATILVIQLVAIAGAYLMSWLVRLIGNIKVLMLVVVLWIVVCLSAFFIHSEIQFYILAVLVGLVMGGTQSISRSTFSKLIPEQTEDTTSFFSFYDVTEKIAIVIGLFTFGFVEELTGDIRTSALVLTIFFLAGLFFLFRVPRVSVLLNVR